jgi:hypothetical protein
MGVFGIAMLDVFIPLFPHQEKISGELSWMGMHCETYRMFLNY